MSLMKSDNYGNQAGTLQVPAQYVVRGSAKAWANLNGTGTIALRDSLNVSSVVDNGTGDYQFNFTSAFTGATYGMTLAVSQYTQLMNPGSLNTASACFAWSMNSSFANTDATWVCPSVHGDLA